MTWCSKIYGMFNGWNANQNESPPIESSRTRRINSSFYRHEIEDESNDSTIIQHDSPFSEKSDSLINSHFPNESNEYYEQRDYQGEHVCADTLFSCHQRDGLYYDHSNPYLYGIATISNPPLDLAQYGTNRENNFHRQLQRSNSFESPMELKGQRFNLTSLTQVTPRMRYSLNRQRTNNDRSHRLSLNHASTINSEFPSENRQESFGYRISTRSTRSIPDYESNEYQSRNNEQLEQDIQYHIKQMLTSSPNGVFPMIYRLPIDEFSRSDEDGYRVEGGYNEPSQWQLKTKIDSHDCTIQSDNIAFIYTHYFHNQAHHNYYAIDDQFNPLVISVLSQNDRLRMIVRTKFGSKYIEVSEGGMSTTDCISLAKQLYPNLHIDRMEEFSNSESNESIRAFDDKLETRKFKFGIIYQRKGQITEEEFFNNDKHSPTFDEFLGILATRVSLKNFKGYRGGLDISEQTDSPSSYYECYGDKEIMFHVSTLLPFTPNDPSQIQRKRHIGNDIVTIIFQEENTPFHPCMIKSSFLHVFLVIQPAQILSRPCYKIMLITRDDVEDFPPFLQPNVVYIRTAENLKSFLLSKLINGEYAAYRCGTFSLLQERTRCSFLKNLCENLMEKPYEQLCDEQKRVGHRRSSILSNSARKRYFSSMKKIFSRSSTISDETIQRDSVKSEPEKMKISKKLMKLGKSMDSVEDHGRTLAEHSNGRSDESLDSSGEMTSSITPNNQVHYADESDEGLDSMSSADTARAHYDSDDAEGYRQQLREKSQPSHMWHRPSTHRGFVMPQVAGIHLSEEATV